MYAQVSFLGMLNPEGEEGFKFDIMKRSAMDFNETMPSPSSSCSPIKEGGGGGEMKAGISARKESEEKKEELDDDDDDNDGFKTPTSLDYKIPVPKQCPPAPRKPRPLKRKASPAHSSNATVDVGNLVQLLLPDSSKQVKKPRTQEKK